MEKKKSEMDNKFVKAKICCNCSRVNNLEEKKCSDCGQLMAYEISTFNFNQHISKLRSKKKKVNEDEFQ